MKKTSPNLPYTDRFRFWSRTHGGTSPHRDTGGTQPVNSHQLGDLPHHHGHSISQPALETIDLEAQNHVSHHTHSHGLGGNGNTGSTTAVVAPSSTDSKVNKTTSEAASKGPVVNDTQQAQPTDPTPDSKPSLMVRFARTSKMILLHSKLNLLLVFVPVGIIVSQVHTSPGIIFAMNAIAIIPLAGLLSHATESVARKFGDATGALLNVTFGNAVELIIL